MIKLNKPFKLTIQILIYICIAILFIPFFFEYDTIPVGRFYGNMALGAFLLTITPGILKRFKVKGLLLRFQLLLMFSRRQLGILTFMFSLLHYQLVKMVPVVKSNVTSVTFETYEWWGLLAFALFIPLLITSNNFSVRFLKQNWNRLHKIIYAIAWILFLHVALQGKLLQLIVLGLFVILEMSSLIYKRVTTIKKI